MTKLAHELGACIPAFTNTRTNYASQNNKAEKVHGVVLYQSIQG